MNELEPIEGRLQGSLNRDITSGLRVSTHGLVWASMEQVMEFAKLMALSQVAVPKHLRNNPGACLGIVIQAINWEMDPFAVANKSYSVSDRLAYEAQLINAVILRRAPIIGRFNVSYSGDGEKRRCKVSATLKDGNVFDYESPELGRIPTKNSPLWKGDPDQQLFYYSSRAFCRRHFPEFLLGVYSKDELEDNAPPIRHTAIEAKDTTEPSLRPVTSSYPPKTLGVRLTVLVKSSLNDVTGIEEPQHDAETGEITGDDPDIDPDIVNAPDAETAAVLLSGKLAARNGQAEFTKWRRRLSAPDFERAEPFMEEFHAILVDKEAKNVRSE